MLTLLYVGSESCHNCTEFEPEWDKLAENLRGRGVENIPLSLEKIKKRSHTEFPPALQETVTFYPFIMLLPTDYYRNNVEKQEVLVGEVLYAYKKMNGGNLEYRVCRDTQDSPSMRYPRTAEGILSWIEDVGLTAIVNLAPRYYPDVLLPVAKPVQQRALKVIDWNGEKTRFSRDVLLFPSLHKVYELTSGGTVLHRRIRNNHD